jgi:hypothetical protein
MKIGLGHRVRERPLSFLDYISTPILLESLTRLVGNMSGYERKMVMTYIKLINKFSFDSLVGRKSILTNYYEAL